MINQPLLNNTALVRQILHTGFYSNEIVRECICAIVQNNKEYITDFHCDWQNKTIQIKFKKAFFKKMETENTNFYIAVNNMVMYPLLDMNVPQLMYAFTANMGQQSPSTEEIMTYMKTYINMFYTMTVISNNTIIMYL